jgi:hypothetical protein
VCCNPISEGLFILFKKAEIEVVRLISQLHLFLERFQLLVERNLNFLSGLLQQLGVLLNVLLDEFLHLLSRLKQVTGMRDIEILQTLNEVLVLRAERLVLQLHGVQVFRRVLCDRLGVLQLYLDHRFQVARELIVLNYTRGHPAQNVLGHSNQNGAKQRGLAPRYISDK